MNKGTSHRMASTCLLSFQSSRGLILLSKKYHFLSVANFLLLLILLLLLLLHLLLLSSSIGTTAHCGLWPVEQCPSIFFLSATNSLIFSLPELENIFLLPLSIFSWVFSFASSLPALEWRSSWASYPPPFSLGDLTSLSFAWTLLGLWINCQEGWHINNTVRCWYWIKLVQFVLE